MITVLVLRHQTSQTSSQRFSFFHSDLLSRFSGARMGSYTRGQQLCLVVCFFTILWKKNVKCWWYDGKLVILHTSAMSWYSHIRFVIFTCRVRHAFQSGGSFLQVPQDPRPSWHLPCCLAREVRCMPRQTQGICKHQILSIPVVGPQFEALPLKVLWHAFEKQLP